MAYLNEDWEIPSCMRQYGVDKTFLRETEKYTCPSCGFQFNLLYARAVSCLGCMLSVRGCEYVRCPRCDYEFSIRGTKAARRAVSSRLSRVLGEFHKEFGESPAR